MLVGNINIWICRLETVLRWQQQLQNLQMTEVCAFWPASESAVTSQKPLLLLSVCGRLSQLFQRLFLFTFPEYILDCRKMDLGQKTL